MIRVGQIVKVWVLEVDLQKGRLQLTMIDPEAPVVQPKPKEKVVKQNKPKKPFTPKKEVKAEGEKAQENKPQQNKQFKKPFNKNQNQNNQSNQNKKNFTNNQKRRNDVDIDRFKEAWSKKQNS